MSMELFKKNVLLCAALLLTLAWPAHEVFAHAGDSADCQVCAVSLSPQLNSDCGTRLLPLPENFVLAETAAPAALAESAASAPFYGRAPPALN